MGSNAYRASHNAPTPELLEACDSLGMLVLDEQRLLNSSSEYKEQFKRLLIRDRNHASVFLWSIGNEEQNIQGNEYGKKIAQSLLAIQKEIDPSRTSTYAADMGNDYKGVNEVIPIRGFNYREYAVSDYHRDHPNQPILGTEMGSTVTTRGIYVTDSIELTFLTKILLLLGGRVKRRLGGSWLLKISIGWAVLYGLDLIIAESQHLLNGQILILILE